MEMKQALVIVEIVICQNKLRKAIDKIVTDLEGGAIWKKNKKERLFSIKPKISNSNISEHIKHLFEEGELSQVVVVRNFRTTESDGKDYNYIARLQD